MLYNKSKNAMTLPHRGGYPIYNKERARACEKFTMQRYNTTQGVFIFSVLNVFFNISKWA